ncbi:MAG: RDD family protein [Bauldia sp.]|nr:RDD family protein [Bauldia sp.]
MTVTDNSGQPGASYDVFVQDRHPAFFVDVLPRRLIAFAIDMVIVIVLMLPVLLAVLVLGILTFGLGWVLFPFVFGVVGLGYLALTLGGENSATVGMKTVGIELRTIGGQKMYPLLAVLHGLLFWTSVSLLTPLILIVAFLNPRNRLLHDMLLGVVMVNSDALPNVAVAAA